MHDEPQVGGDILFGTETEYAASAGRNGLAVATHKIARLLMAQAAARPHLPGVESGIFLPNAGRFYVDQSHPEYATPECSCPWEAARYSFAGDRLLAALADEVVNADPSMAGLAVSKGNIDYATGVTWGNHESYLLRSHPREVRPGLVAHLATRIVFAGAGGFDPFDTSYPRFVLSPRALFMRQVIGPSSAHAYALVDERSEDHCAGYFRQHLMCGEGLQSHLATLLRLGTTALVVALLDRHVGDLEDVALAQPLAALSTIARDQTLRARVALGTGGEATAVDIQRRLLAEARRHLGSLPPWGAALCDEWEATLDRLACGPDAVADRLDWAVKRIVYRDRARRRGMPWLGQEPDAQGAVAALAPRAGELWRAELCELDVRFGRIYPPGLFDSLDRTGGLSHRVAGIDDLDNGLATPPRHGRARLRGATVGRLAGQAGLTCAWDGVYDLASRRFLDLSDPFCATEAWAKLPPSLTPRAVPVGVRLPSPPVLPSSPDELRRLAERLCAPDARALRRTHAGLAIDINNRGLELRTMGRLEDAEVVLRAALAVDAQARPPNHPKLAHRRNNLAGVLIMRGHTEEARQLVSQAWSEKGQRYELTSARVLTTRLVIALLVREPTALFVGQLKTHLAIQPLPDYAEVDPHWVVAPMFTWLERHLGEEDLGLLRRVAAVLNRETTVETLDTLPAWADRAARPLEEPWPA